MERFIISRDDSIYEAWPDIVLTNTGKLICVFTECESHGKRDLARLVVTESTDKGRTWSKKIPLTDRGTKDAYYNCARISKLPNGKIVIVCDFSHGEKMDDITITHMWTSDDDGKTWVGPSLLPCDGIVPDKYLVLKNGRHIVSTHRLSRVTSKLEQSLWYSDDNGLTWSDKVMVASDKRYNLCEGSILETKSGDLICYLRENSGIGYDCLKTISHDNGETWSEVINVPIPGCHRPVSGYLDDGNVMITHRYMQGGKGWLGSWTQNLFTAILNGEQILCESRNEQSARIFPIDFDRSSKSDLGYSGWVQFPDGEIYIAYYIVDDAPKAQIRGCSIRKEDYLL